MENKHEIYIDNKKVASDYSVKLLGIEINNQLNFDNHCVCVCVFFFQFTLFILGIKIQYSKYIYKYNKLLKLQNAS